MRALIAIAAPVLSALLVIHPLSPSSSFNAPRVQAGDCGCTDDPPFVRDRVSSRPTRSELAQITARLSGDCADAAIAARELGTLADPSSVRPLLGALRHRSCRVRTAAADALGHFNDHQAVPGLINALSDSDPRVRASATWSLASLPDERAVPALLIAVTDSEKHVRQGAATALGDIGDPRAGPALTRALKDPQKEVRQAAAEAIGKLRHGPALQPVAESDAGRCSWQGWLPPDVGRQRVRSAAYLDAVRLATLQHQAVNGDKAMRLVAIDKLAAAEDNRTTRLLLDIANGSDHQLAEMATRSLGRMGAPTAISTITRLASSTDPQLRQAAVWSLGQLQSPSSLPTLLTASADTNKHVRDEAAWALGLIGRTEAVPRLEQLTRDENAQVREAAACSLTRLSR